MKNRIVITCEWDTDSDEYSCDSKLEAQKTTTKQVGAATSVLANYVSTLTERLREQAEQVGSGQEFDEGIAMIATVDESSEEGTGFVRPIDG